MKEPRILIGDSIGKHNANLDESIKRIDKSKMYKDNSTIMICPTRGMFPTIVVQSWMKLLRPMNQQLAGPIFAESMKVDVAYETLIEYILTNEHLNKYKYILTIEEDNLPPADGLIKLYECMDDYDVVGGLYWSKGDLGFPMIFGNPEDPTDFKPVVPIPNSLQRANALGMGFNLFKLDMFKHIPKPWFKTEEGKNEDGGTVAITQDMYFYKKAGALNFKFACKTDILVGHYDNRTEIIY